MNTQTSDLQISNFRYSKDNVLGKGSTGTVYLGSDIRTGNKVAIKIIDMKTIDNQVTTYLLNNEKKALNLLKHPNIVSTYQIIQNAEYCYIVGEYCQGGTLYDYIKAKGRLTEKQSVEMLKGLVSGYNECVKFGITHRDLKPTNVLLKGGVPKIIDFGYAEIVGVPKPKIYYNVGSPSYMAPDQKSDIWSLGVSFYQMLTGQVPLDTKDVMKTFNELSKNGVKFPGYVSIFCRQIINRCMIPNIEKRIDLDHLSKLIRCEGEDHQTMSTEIKRPVSELGMSGRLKSMEKPPLSSQRAATKNPIMVSKQQNPSITRQPVQQAQPTVPLKLSNQNKNQQELNSEYFTESNNSKKLRANQPPIYTQKYGPKMSLKNIQVKSPLMSSKHQQQMNQMNRNSNQKTILIRPVSMNGNLMLSSKHSNSSANSLKGAYSIQSTQVPPNIVNSSNIIRPISPATNFVGHQQVRPVQNLTNSIHNKVNLNANNGVRQTVQHGPIMKVPESMKLFYKNYYN